MSKIKTHKGAAKRFRFTASGRVKRRRAYDNHYFERKTSRRKRRLERPAYVHKSDEKRVRRLLPGRS
jgi:large subunit ribosomal protein L35